MTAFLLFCSIMTMIIVKNIDNVVYAKEFSTLNNLSTIEMTKERNEFSKYYINDDGTVTVDTYSVPIHYKDSNGYWIDIDNTLKTDIDLLTVTNNNSLLDINLSKNTKIGELASIEVDDYKVSWSIENLKSSNGIVENNLATTRNGSSPISSKMTYNNILENTNLEYTLTSYALIEEMVFSKLPNYDKIIYNIKVDNLKARLDNKQVIFYDKNNIEKEIFRFSVPFLIDSAENPNINMNVGVELKTTTTGYQVIHHLDTEWLKSDDIVYPVTLDPVVTSYQHYSNIADTYTNSTNANTNYSNESYLQIGKINGNNYTYIKINSFPVLPGDAEITSAKLNYYLNYGTGSWGLIDIYSLNNSWTSSTLTWNSQSTLVSSAQLYDTSLTPISSGGYYKYDVDITEWFKDYYSGEIQNYGFMLKYQNENYNDCNWIYASDNLSISSTYLPSITITYSVLAGDYRNFNWHYPLPSTYTYYTQGWSTTHHALDISVPVGQPVYAVSDGVVTSVLTTSMGYTMGNGVAIRTNDIDHYLGNNLVASYGHLNSILVSVGQNVTRGQIIGYSGNTGNTTGPHLHFEVHRNGQNWATHNPSEAGNTVNPLEFWQ